jgi:hypothetical protein
LSTVSEEKFTVAVTLLPKAPAVVVSVNTTEETLLGKVVTEKLEADTTNPKFGVIVILPDVIILLKNIEAPFNCSDSNLVVV